MIPFSELRTSRLVAAFKESPIVDSMRICGIPSHELSTGEFLKAVVTESSIELKDWTVAERIFAITHYLGHTSEEGADFSVGNGGKLSDYIHYDKEWKEAPTDTTTIEGEEWSAIHFLGRYAESIERIQGHIDTPEGMHWIVGEMAARLRNEADTEGVEDTIIDDWMIERMKLFLSYPDEHLYALIDFMEEQAKRMIHLLDIEVSYQGGIVCIPKDREDGSELLAPANFPCTSCIHPRTRNLQEIFNQLSGEPFNNL